MKSTTKSKITYSTIEDWFDIYYKVLCQRVLRLVRQEDVAEDIVQNTFYKLWRKGGNITIPDSAEAYLKRLVFNESIDWLRKNERYKLGDNEELFISIPSEEQIDDLENSEIIKKKLHEILAELPPKCHTVFVLSRFENLTYEEIANYLGISVKTVENHIGKAIKHIRNNFPKDLLPFILFYSNWIN